MEEKSVTSFAFTLVFKIYTQFKIISYGSTLQALVNAEIGIKSFNLYVITY